MGTLYDTYLQLTDRSFASAVRLIRQHAPKAVTPRILMRFEQIVVSGSAPGEYDWGKAEAAMRASPPGPTSAESTGNRGNVAGTPDADQGANASEKPASVGAARALHKQHSHYHAIMVSTTDKATRADAARRIMCEILPALDAHYSSAPTGTTPPPPSETAPGGEALLRRLQSLRTRVSRLRKHLIPSAGSDARRISLEKELALKLVQIQGIENDLQG